MHPTLVDLGFYQLPSYGVLVALGVVAGLLTLKRRGDRAGLDGAQLVDVGLWLVIWALVGAKGLLVLVELPRYLHNPAEIIGLVRAGGVFLGGFLAAIVAAIVLFRRHRLPPLATLDAFIPSVALGQAIGRIGCLLAGCCWGSRCDLPWAITYTDPAAAANVGTPLHVAVHPYPAYESLLDFGLYLVLELLYSRRPSAGRLFATYLLAYGSARFLLEWTRGDAARGFVLSGALSTSQLIALAMIGLGTALQFVIARRRTP
jgi:phosphatidylglycerol:prolipoprotein diacylglycerol transferase